MKGVVLYTGGEEHVYKYLADDITIIIAADLISLKASLSSIVCRANISAPSFDLLI